MTRVLRTLACLLVVSVAGCGTTSNIQPEKAPEVASAAAGSQGKASLDLSLYERVAVLDYTDATDKSGIKPDQQRAYADSVATATRSFPDLIAQKVRDTKAFQEVLRGPSSGKALVVSGRITRMAEGNGFARFMLPGAGMSHFEATTDLADSESGEVLGHVTTDKNSWALGGGIAASQSVQSFMQGAAEKIADQLKAQKKPPAVGQRN